MPVREGAGEIPSLDSEIDSRIQVVVVVHLVTRADEDTQQRVRGHRLGRELVLVQEQFGLGIRQGGAEQVSKPLGRDVHVELERSLQPVRLDGREEKSAISHQRTAKRAAPLVPLGRRLLVQEKRFGHQACPFVAVKEAPVPDVRAGLGDDVEIAGQRLTELGRRNPLDDLHLADRFDAHDVDLADAVVLRNLSRSRIGARIRAIGGDGHGCAAEPVESQANTAGAAAAGAAAFDRSFLPRQAGAKIEQVRKVPVGGRKRADLLRLEVDPLLGRRSVDHRRFPAHRNTFLNCTDLQRERAANTLGGPQ